MPYKDHRNKITCTSSTLPGTASGYLGRYFPTNIPYSATINFPISQSPTPHLAPAIPSCLPYAGRWSPVPTADFKSPLSGNVRRLTHTAIHGVVPRIPANYQDRANTADSFSHQQERHFNENYFLPAQRQSSLVPQLCVPNWSSLRQHMPTGDSHQSMRSAAANSKNAEAMRRHTGFSESSTLSGVEASEGLAISGCSYDPIATTVIRTKRENQAATIPSIITTHRNWGTNSGDFKSLTYFTPPEDEGALSSNFSISPLGDRLECLPSAAQPASKHVEQNIKEDPFSIHGGELIERHHPHDPTPPQSSCLGACASTLNSPHCPPDAARNKLLNVHFAGCQKTPSLSIGGNGIPSDQSLSAAVPSEQVGEMPERLKRPMNGYLLFNKEIRRRLPENNPNMTVAEISREIGRQWKHLSEEERSRYIERARLLKSEFLRTHPDYVYSRRSKAEMLAAGLSVRGRRKAHLVDAGGQGISFPEKDPRGRKKKYLKNFTAPKHPMSGYLFYLAMRRPMVMKQKPGTSVGTVSKIVAGEWKTMPPSEREPWERKAADDKARYAKEMEVYNVEALTSASVGGADSPEASRSSYDSKSSTVPAVVTEYPPPTSVCMPIEHLVQPHATVDKKDASSDSVLFPGYNYIS